MKKDAALRAHKIPSFHKGHVAKVNICSYKPHNACLRAILQHSNAIWKQEHSLEAAQRPTAAEFYYQDLASTMEASEIADDFTQSLSELLAEVVGLWFSERLSNIGRT